MCWPIIPLIGESKDTRWRPRWARPREPPLPSGLGRAPDKKWLPPLETCGLAFPFAPDQVTRQHVLTHDQTRGHS
jgi:hypothetical protein